MEFLDVIESIRAEDASVQRLFGGEGAGARSTPKSAQYLKKLAEAAKFMADVYQGRRPLHHLREAMTTSDFPQLFGDILDRQLLAGYREAPAIWPLIARRSRTRDFRNVKRYTLDGGEGTLPEVEQDQEYPETALTDAEHSWRVRKYGRRLPLSFETIINDDLDAFRDIPGRFGKAARRTEEKFATELHVGASGPHASFYTVGNGNIVTGNPALSIAALQQAMTILSNMRDTEGEPIVVEAMVLVVPPALEITAYNIVNAVQLELTESGGTSGQKLVAPNWMQNRIKVAVNYYIPIVATANGNTSWFLFANPSNGRPALEIGFLIGREEPEIFTKAPNAVRVGGGSDMVDFDNDAINYKVRHVFGGGRIDPKMSVASNGSGS